MQSCLKPHVIAFVFTFFNFLCWGFPFLLVIVLGRLYHLGYAETADIGQLPYDCRACPGTLFSAFRMHVWLLTHTGWCYISLLPTEPDVKFDEKLVLPLSYESWTWLILMIIFICIVGYAVVFCYSRLQGGKTDTQPVNSK